MINPEVPPPAGRLDARYLAFQETVAQLRPSLHRFCARMTGSVMDGEDVVQEALFEAFRNLERYDATRPLKPWLFRIAHHRCIDLLRKRGVRSDAEAAAAEPDTVAPAESHALGLDQALEYLVIQLPPMERACVLLKDVFDYTLEETADFVESTVGGVKAALHRGRTRLKASPVPKKIPAAKNPELARLLHLYVERFNRRDWAGVRELISADAGLNVVGRYAGKLADSPYFSRYEDQTAPWQLAVGEVDGQPMVILCERVADAWKPRAPIRFEVVDQRIVGVRDYFFCPWMLEAAPASAAPNASG